MCVCVQCQANGTQAATLDVQCNKDPEFKAEWMLIAFWDEVPVYPHSWVDQYPQYYSAGFRDTILNDVCCGTLSHVMSHDSM